MISLIFLITISLSHVYDIETPSTGITLSLLELSYSSDKFVIRTSPAVLPFMFPIVLRFTFKNAFLRLGGAPFYGGYLIKAQDPGIKKVKIQPAFTVGGGMWLHAGKLRIIPDVGLYYQKKTLTFFKIATGLQDVYIEAIIGAKSFQGLEAVYILRQKKMFIILGLKYPGIKYGDLDIPVFPIFNLGITF